MRIAAIAFRIVTNHSFDAPSYTAFASGYGLTSAAMRWFWGQYLAKPDDGTKPLASPLRAHLRGLPSAFVITAKFDPIRDEGEDYAARLRAAGVRHMTVFGFGRKGRKELVQHVPDLKKLPAR
jgi:acetyl esterase/lipase